MKGKQLDRLVGNLLSDLFQDCHATDDHQVAGSNLILDKRPPSPFLKPATRAPVSTSTSSKAQFVPISLPPRVQHPFFIPPPPSQRPPLPPPSPPPSPPVVPSGSSEVPHGADESTEPAPVYVPSTDSQTSQDGVSSVEEDEDISTDVDISEASVEQPSANIHSSGYNTLTRFSAVRHHPQAGLDNRPGNYWQQQVVSIRPRNIRVRRDVDALGVKGTFRVIAAQDLAFAPNATADEAAIVYSHGGGGGGHIVYGTVCLPALSLAAGLGLLGLLAVCCACIAAYLFWVLRTYSALNRNKCSMN